MAVPKSKVTRSKRGMRRAHDRLELAVFVEDQESGNLRRNHHIDLKAGTYNGRQVLPPQED
jgi:large subunit ribosomal protein L32